MKIFAIPYLLTLSLAAACGSSQPAANDNAQPTPAPVEAASEQQTSQDIVDIASGNSDFSTLVAAIQAADLAGALKSEGPFTVFAPTNEAFAKLPEGTIEALLEDKQKLTEILTYHVVSGRVMAADVVGIDSATTL